MFVDPRGRGSVRSQAADSAFENLRMRGKREREGGVDRRERDGDEKKCRGMPSIPECSRRKQKSELSKILDEIDHVR